MLWNVKVMTNVTCDFANQLNIEYKKERVTKIELVPSKEIYTFYLNFSRNRGRNISSSLRSIW